MFSLERLTFAAAFLMATAATAAEGPKLGQAVSPADIAACDISIAPDGIGLPPGQGTSAQGEAVYFSKCVACHGEKGMGKPNDVLVGGAGSLAAGQTPVKTVGSYWPYATTLFDYIRRAMPFGNAQSLTNDELYAITAYVLYLNDIVKSEDFELNQKNFGTIKLPNQPNFYDDDREVTEKAFWKKNPCMTNCAPGEAKVTGRARSIDVTPEAKGPKAE